MPASLLENLPEALAGVKTRPLFVMRLNSRVQIIGPTPGYVRRVGVVFGGAFEGERLSGEVLTGAMIGRRFAAIAPSPWMSVLFSRPTTKR